MSDLPKSAYHIPPSVELRETPRCLLTNGSFLGTLAITRSLGRRAQQAILADPEKRTRTSFSRYLTEQATPPASQYFDELLEWFMEWGQKKPGAVLYPCSDDMAWFLSHHADLLSHCFRLYSPPAATIQEILIKPRLYRAAQAVGLGVMPTIAPGCMDDLQQQSDQIAYPALIKPQTQVALPSRKKGQYVASATELKASYTGFREDFRYQAHIKNKLATIDWPMVQSFSETAATETYSVSGFVNETVFLARASIKRAQFPVKVGIGICFSNEVVDPTLAEKLQALCQSIGYFGVFEAEFIKTAQGDFCLMDFNPRYFGQIGFDLARALPVDQLVIAGAYGKPEYIEQIQKLEEKGHWKEPRELYFSNTRQLQMLALTLFLSRQISRQQRKRWRRWASLTAPGLDHVLARDDPKPVWADRLHELQRLIQHPRSTLRDYFLV